MEEIKKNILKNINFQKKYNNYSYLFKIKFEDIVSLWIKTLSYLIIKLKISEINIEINFKHLEQFTSYNNKLKEIWIKVNSFIIIETKDIILLEKINIENISYVLNLEYSLYDKKVIEKNINNFIINWNIFFSLEYFKNQEDINKSYFLEIYNNFRKKWFKINNEIIRKESAYKNIYVIWPREINFDLSEYCNANCVFCFTNWPWNLDNRNWENENNYKMKINIEKIKKLINELEYIWTEIISVWISWEPLIDVKYTKTFLEEISKTNLKVWYLTNWYNLIKNIDDIKKCKNIESFTINISAWDYNSFLNTRIWDNFYNFLNTWKAIKFIKNERKDIKIKALYIVTNKNYLWIRNFLKLCKTNNIDEIEINKATIYEFSKNIDIKIEKEKIYSFLRKEYKKIKFKTNIDIFQKEIKWENILDKKNCLNHYSYLWIYKNWLYSCCKFNFKLWNLWRLNILDIIKNLENNNKIFNINENILWTEDIKEKCDKCIQYKNTKDYNNFIKVKKCSIYK